ncbi:MAG TPA: hypothetical protein VGH94_06855 [Acidimicrobiales bacterium]|jgi:hypothetical protein
MRAGGPADRFRDLIRQRLLPGLGELGFESAPGVLAARPAPAARPERAGVRWFIDIELAPWTNPDKICFAAAWGVHVPGLAAAMGQAEPLRPTIADCPVRGLVSLTDDDRDPAWHRLTRRPWPLWFVQDVACANAFLGSVAAHALPKLRALDTVVKVQEHVFSGLVGTWGAPEIDELQTIAQVAAMSHLLGERQNALRWLDHLRERSCAAMAPEVVDARLAPLREIVLAS